MLKLFISIVLLIVMIAYKILKTPASCYVKSSIDNKYYLVQDRKDKQQIADDLARIRKNIIELTKYMLNNSSDSHKQYIRNINDKLNHVTIAENIKDLMYTSYSVNKGEQLVFCMRSRKKQRNNEKHDLNLMMYVVLHEISHIACPEYGHTQLFKEIFKYITETAVQLDMYHPIDFRATPTEYCGMTITDSII